MLKTTIAKARSYLHAQLCYQYLITPLYLPIEKKYRLFAEKACDYFESKRDEVIHKYNPRHHIIYRFKQANNPKAKKVLIAHGWMSRAAYMVQTVWDLHQQGYEVFAPDLPAHGESNGLQLPWTDAVLTLKNIMNEYGPFHAVIGHSFGGSMLLNSINLSGQLENWKINHLPNYVILIASPTRMRTPVHQVAKLLRLDSTSYMNLRNVFYNQTDLNPKLISLSSFLRQKPSIPFLCIHGENDKTVPIQESDFFCDMYPHGKIELLPDADHVTVLMDKRVKKSITDFIR